MLQTTKDPPPGDARLYMYDSTTCTCDDVAHLQVFVVLYVLGHNSLGSWAMNLLFGSLERSRQRGHAGVLKMLNRLCAFFMCVALHAWFGHSCALHAGVASHHARVAYVHGAAHEITVQYILVK